MVKLHIVIDTQQLTSQHLSNLFLDVPFDAVISTTHVCIIGDWRVQVGASTNTHLCTFSLESNLAGQIKMNFYLQLILLRRVQRYVNENNICENVPETHLNLEIRGFEDLWQYNNAKPLNMLSKYRKGVVKQELMMRNRGSITA
ncbi:hypothetical protein ACJX0J_009700 [Zea mays]